MCRIPNLNLAIKKIDASKRGRISAVLSDNREVTVPISFFPDIKRLSIPQRKRAQIIEDHYFTFPDSNEIYSIIDLMYVFDKDKPTVH